MAKIYTYIPPAKKGGVVSENCATKDDLRQGVQEAKDYTDIEIEKLNNGANHQHDNKSLLDKFTESNGDLFFNGKNMSGIVYADVEG